MPATDSCITGRFTPGAIGASSGETPTIPSLPTLIDPGNYDPATLTYSLDYSKFYNSPYFLMLFV